jgi:hypothetical protein
MLATVRGSLPLLIGAIVVSVAAQHAPTASSPGQIWNALAAGNQRFASGKPQRRDRALTLRCSVVPTAVCRRN